MFSVVKLNTGIVEGLGVGFYTDTLPSGNLACTAFVVKDEQGYFSSNDIQEGVFDSGLILEPNTIQGLIPFAYTVVQNDGTLHHQIDNDFIFSPFVEELFVTDNEVYKEHMRMTESGSDSYILDNPLTVLALRQMGLAEKEQLHFDTIFEEMSKLITMTTDSKEVIERLKK